MMIPMRVDVNLHSCDFEIRSTLSEILDAVQFYIFWLRIPACLLHIVWMCLDILMLWPQSYDDIFVHAKTKMDIYYPCSYAAALQNKN